MNPYLAAGLAMCAVLFIALALTAYMAVYFNRRSKADLEAALRPLADVLDDGTLDLDAATVRGRFNRRLVIAMVTTAEGGPVRVFRTDVVDPAGGTKWLLVSLPPRKDQTDRTEEFEATDPALRAQLRLPASAELARSLEAGKDWFQLEYDPDGGYVRLTKPMDTRKDIPGVDLFRSSLELLEAVAARNREVQQAPATPSGSSIGEQRDV
ncbi:MAG: hypothetical protein AVDCRST_MAG87-3018 [uncultured Thermomicrobiales bacterium]|uniref:Uncharacterized protein n=1 Tax=uncultured Thermomicrobiales bacterium TaxID=1645740 RepID=A0A6J4VFJ6_9BACT|nr:MAG: hypothetical protein AVDCRST_MAG87-3018 [uncultured Thermomicrobiales bacterium]